MTEVPDPEVVELATKIFDLARRGQTEALVAYVDAGVPANLTNDRGLFTILRDSITHITRDRRLQLLLVAFSFGRTLSVIDPNDTGFRRDFQHERTVSGVTFEPKGRRIATSTYGVAALW